MKRKEPGKAHQEYKYSYLQYSRIECPFHSFKRLRCDSVSNEDTAQEQSK